MSTNSNDKKNPAPEDTDEGAHLDDAVIGRAFRWSTVAFVAIGLVVAGVVIFQKRKPEPPPVQQTKLTAPVASERAPAEIPAARFIDITTAAGITFVHNNGAYGDKLLPETMGGGCAFFDFDNDGDPDLLFINSTTWPWKTSDQKPTMVLYRNDGKGHFEDVTAGSGLDGARVNVKMGGQTLSREVMPTRGYLSQSELPVTIGLGTSANPDEVEIIWPGGARQRVEKPNVDATTQITEER